MTDSTRHGRIGRRLVMLAGFLTACSGGTALAADPEVRAVPLAEAFLAGSTGAPVPPYKKEITVSGMQQMYAAQGFSGAFSVLVMKIEDGGAIMLKNYPFDQFIQVLAGTTTLINAAGGKQTFVAGQSFVIPKGFTGTWQVSPGFRELTVLDNEQLKLGMAQFEN